MSGQSQNTAERSGADDWYYKAYGLELGPITFQDLLVLAQGEQLLADDQVKLGQLGKWRAAGSIGQLMAVMPYSAVTRQIETKARPVAASTQLASGSVDSQAKVVSKVATERLIMRSDHGNNKRDTSSVIESRSEAAPRTRADVPQVTTSTSVNQIPQAAAPARAPAATSPVEVRPVASLPVSRPPSSPSIPIVNRPAPVYRPPRTQGPGLFSRLWDGVQGLNPIRAVSAVAVLGLLGFGVWSFGSGPSRPVSVHPVKGRVVIDGQPLANASIVLHRIGDSKVPSNLHPRARATESGAFELETFDPKDGAPNGEFVATVLLNQVTEVNGEKQAGPNTLPVVYSRPDTSPLKLTITASTTELQPLELTRK